MPYNTVVLEAISKQLVRNYLFHGIILYQSSSPLWRVEYREVLQKNDTAIGVLFTCSPFS